MARNFILVKRELLYDLYNKHLQGVPTLALIRNYNLEGSITQPTLARLFKYLVAHDGMGANSIRELVSHDIQAIIKASLFPEWLEDDTTDGKIIKAPPNFRYIGKMPLGRWIKLGTKEK